MSFNVKVGGTWRDAASLWVKVSGTWQQVASAWVKVSGAWQQVYSSLAADAGANVSSSSSGASACGNPGVTGTPGASATGGKPPLTYLWAQTGTPAANGPYTCSDTTALNPSWGAASVCDGDSPASETWQLTVTDDNGNSVTDTITVTLTWVNTS